MFLKQMKSRTLGKPLSFETIETEFFFVPWPTETLHPAPYARIKLTSPDIQMAIAECQVLVAAWYVFSTMAKSALGTP